MAVLTKTKNPSGKAKGSTKKDAKGAAAEEQGPKLSKKAKAEMDKPFVATLPMVNLLAPEVQEVVEQQRIKRLFALIAVGLAAVMAVVWLLQTGMIAVAKNRLEGEQARAAELTAKQASLAPVQAFYGQVEANKFTIQSTMSKEVLASDVLARLNAVTPAGLKLGTIAVTLDTTPAAAPGTAVDPTMTTSTCPSQDPYSPAAASAGCVSVDGTAASRAVLSEWLDNLEKDPTFTVAFIPSSSAGSDSGGVTFNATIGLDAEAVYKERYSNPEFLKAGAN